MTKILLADDSVTIQKVVELTFSDHESEVTAVSDGNSALEKVKLQKPDIILSDVIMPGMDGYELCQAVKNDPTLRDIPFLFLKGTFESFDEEKAKQCGADGFIVKPFESQELIDKVKGLVSGASQPAEPRQAAAEAPAASVPPPAAPQQEEVSPAPPAAPPAPEPSAPVMPTPTTAEAAAAEGGTNLQPPVEESFDLGEEDMLEDAGPAVPPEQEHAAEPAAPAPEAEQEEDLWSEVSLRESESPLIEDKVLEDESFWGTADPMESPEEPVEAAPAGEDLLEEVEEPEVFDLSGEEMEPEAIEDEPAPSAETPAEEAAGPESFLYEEPVEATAGTEPAFHLADEQTAAPDSSTGTVGEVVAEEPRKTVDAGELEKAISAKIEDAVRSVLGPAVEETARKIVEDIAWEVIPDLAEAMIKSEIERIKAENS